MTGVTSVCYCFCAGCELLITADTERKGSWRVRSLPMPRGLFLALPQAAAGRL